MTQETKEMFSRKQKTKQDNEFVYNRQARYVKFLCEKRKEKRPSLRVDQ